MKIAFVGVKRKYSELAPDYISAFDRFHLELPWYFARDGQNDVTITTTDYRSAGCLILSYDKVGRIVEGNLCHTTEESYVNSDRQYDVTIHWRKFFPEFVGAGKNLIVCQDHSFSDEWLTVVQLATKSGRLNGILCFPGWHKRNLAKELDWSVDSPLLIDGLTLGVDTEIYVPSPTKNRKQMLWASDPGRGLWGACRLAADLFRSGFSLDVCTPDYVERGDVMKHPAIYFAGNIPNGPRLWGKFNSSGVLPYTSTFMEPSSRAHRQAMAAGMLVLYPPDMGTPSELIQDGVTGYVRPISEWADLIQETVADDAKYRRITEAAREYAVSENWSVQAERFNQRFGGST